MSPFSKILDTKRGLTFIIDNPVPVITLILLITVFFGFQLPKLRFQSSIYDLAIENLPEKVAYESFKEEFGTEEIILVVFKSRNIFEPGTFQKIDDLSKKLSQIKGVRRAISLPSIKRDMDLTKKWSLSDFEDVIRPVDLFHRNLISADKKTTVISLILEDLKQKDQIIDSIKEIIDKDADGISLYQIGMPLVSKALAVYTERDFLRLPPFTFAVIAVILLAFFKSLRGLLIPASSVLIVLVWTFGLMAWSQTPISMLLMIVPIFIIAVGTAYCMYVFNEYLESSRISHAPKEAVYLCFTRIGFPTSLAVITTFIALASLLLNRINAIREFAIFSCFGILSMLVVILLLQPAVLVLLPSPRKRSDHGPFKDFLDSFLSKIIKLNLQHQKMMLLTALLLTLAGIIGILKIRVETNPVGYFKRDTSISRNFHDIYQDMAGSFPVNVLLDSRIDNYFEDPEHIAQIANLQDFLNSLEGVDKTISFADYLKLVNYAINRYQKEFYALPKESFEVRMVMNNFKGMLGQDMFKRFLNEDQSKANIMLRTHISKSSDFLLTKEKVLRYLRGHFPKGFDFQVTGFGIVISQSSQLLTKGQVKSLALTMVLIFGVMLLLFLSGKAAFIALIPNCFPIIIAFGLMGWMGIELSVATSLVACIAIGLAVDDTIHYMVRYNKEFKKDLDKDRALRDTIKKIGQPIILTTFTISLGFSILLFSHFGPTSIFGLMMIITMFSALLGDLLILPSLMLHVELVTAWDLLKLMPAQLGLSPGMAHQLVQPLNAIKMGSEFLKTMVEHGGKIPQEQLSDVVNEMSAQVDRTAEIINRLRVLDQKSGFVKEKVDINKPIRDVLNIVGPQLRLENIEFHLDLDDSMPPIMAQNNSLCQVIFNLITNAKEALDKKKEGVRDSDTAIINIRSSLEKDHVTITVSDTGIGIPKDIIGRIFEPFFTTKELGKGKGLGLSITYQIVRDCGGRIHVQSEEGFGTTFKLTFPKASA